GVDPIVDANGVLSVDVNGVVRLHTAQTIAAAGGFHRRGEPVLFKNPQGFWVPAKFNAGDAVQYLGNEPKRFFGGEQVFGTLTDAATAGGTCRDSAGRRMLSVLATCSYVQREGAGSVTCPITCSPPTTAHGSPVR